MANIRTIVQTKVEPFVRDWLAEHYGQRFYEREVFLVTGKRHVCDAVSQDGSIAANILSNRARTRGDNPNTGALRKAENDFWRLANIRGHDVEKRILVFTNESLVDDVRALLGDPGKVGVELTHCPLPADIERELQQTLKAASNAQRSRND